MASEDAERNVGVSGVSGRDARATRARRQVGQHGAPLSPSVHQRPALDAQVARRVDASRERGRAEAGGRRNDRSVGSIVEESGRRVVWTEERATREIRHVRASGAGGSPFGRSRTQPKEQPNESAVVPPSLGGLDWSRYSNLSTDLKEKMHKQTKEFFYRLRPQLSSKCGGR